MNQPREQRARYVGTHAALHPEDAPQASSPLPLVLGRRRAAAVAPQTQEVLDELDNDALYKQRAPSSSRRYLSVPAPHGQTRLRVQQHVGTPPKRRVSQDVPSREEEPVTAPPLEPIRDQRPRPHWLRFVGGSMLFMFFGWVALSNAAAWWQTTQDDWHYGRPRTYQTDAVVGHHDGPGDPSHFTVENLDRHVVVIEFQGGDPTRAVSYVGPTLIGAGQDLAPVTVSFQDVNHDGKPDMVLQLQQSRVVFVNTGNTFRLATSSDHLSQ